MIQCAGCVDLTGVFQSKRLQGAIRCPQPCEQWSEMNPRIVFLILVLATALAAGTMVLLSAMASSGHTGLSALAPFLMLASIAGAVVLLYVAAALYRSEMKRRRRRHEHLADVAARHNLTIRQKESDAFRDAWTVLPEISQQGRIKNVLFGQDEDVNLTIFEHNYTVQTGQAPITIYHTIFAAEAPDWPETRISRRSMLDRVSGIFTSGPGIRTGDHHFDAARIVKSEQERFAQKLLHPHMRRFLLEKDDVVWHIIGGHVCLVYGGSMRTDRLDASIDRLKRFWQLVPEDLRGEYHAHDA